jgi:hypothetical protein
MTPAELCDKYPHVPGSNAWDFPRGPEQLQAIEPEALRLAAASMYLAAEARWAREEQRRQAKEQQRREQIRQAQSREHLEHWGDR